MLWRCFAFSFSASPHMLRGDSVPLDTLLSTRPHRPQGPRVGMTTFFRDMSVRTESPGVQPR